MAHRYFVDCLPEPGSATLDGDLAHHLGRVLRSRPGELVVLGDGRGGSALGTITAVGRDRVDVAVTEVRREPAPEPAVTLAFAPPRQQRGEWLFEHGTEVGVASFQPLWTSRTRPQGERPERWAKVVRAAAGQCDRAWLPEVRPALEFAAFLQQPGLPASRWLATANAAPLRDLAATRSTRQAVLLVGPEGGFTAEEQAAAEAAGFQPCGLGPHILRTETAALIGAAMLLATGARA